MRRNIFGLWLAAILVTAPAFAAVQKLDGTTAPLVDTDGSGGHRPVVEAGGIVTVVDNFNARPSNTTAYAIGQTFNINLAVSGVSTSASPPVVTLAANTLAAGQFITLAGVTGMTGTVNGTWKVGSPTSTTFKLLNADGTNAAALGGTYGGTPTVSQLLVFHVGRNANATGYIQKAEINAKSTTTANGSFRIHLYNNSAVLALVDQSAWTTLAANFPYRTGYIDMPLLQIEGAGGDSAFSQAVNTGLPFTSDANGNLYGVIVLEAAYVPTSAELLSVKITADQY